MPRTSRQTRGQATAGLVADYLQPIAPGCRARPGSYAGNDLEFIGWDVEVKARRDEHFRPVEWIAQAVKRRQPGHILPPMVVLRPDHTGPESVGRFIVMRHLSDDRDVLKELLELREIAWHQLGGGQLSEGARQRLEKMQEQVSDPPDH